MVVPPLRARALAHAQFSVSRPVSVCWSSVRQGSSPAGVCGDVPLCVLVSLARALAHVLLRAVLLCALGGWVVLRQHTSYAIAVCLRLSAPAVPGGHRRRRVGPDVVGLFLLLCTRRSYSISKLFPPSTP